MHYEPIHLHLHAAFEPSGSMAGHMCAPRHWAYATCGLRSMMCAWGRGSMTFRISALIGSPSRWRMPPAFAVGLPI